MSEVVSGLPVHGYRPQSSERIALVNANKRDEERILRQIDQMMAGSFDKRWLAIARTHIEQGYMALNRAVFQPERARLDDQLDPPAAA